MYLFRNRFRNARRSPGNIGGGPHSRGCGGVTAARAEGKIGIECAAALAAEGGFGERSCWRRGRRGQWQWRRLGRCCRGTVVCWTGLMLPLRRCRWWRWLSGFWASPSFDAPMPLLRRMTRRFRGRTAQALRLDQSFLSRAGCLSFQRKGRCGEGRVAFAASNQTDVAVSKRTN